MRRRTVAINARFLLAGRLEGLGNFAYQTIRRIIEAHPEVDFTLLFDAQYSPEFVFGPNVTPVVLFPPARRNFLWYWWFEISVARWLRKHPQDLFLSPENFGSLRADVPQVIVIHDLAFEHFRDHVSSLSGKYYRYFTPRYARHAKRIAAVSSYSKQDVVARYGIAPEMIDIVYSGAKQAYQPVSSEVKAATEKQYARGKKYMLFVGAIHPRKNVARMLAAFDKFKETTGAEHLLVLAGRNAWDVEDVRSTHERMKHKEDVVFLGYVPEAALPDLVASADVLLFTSLFEGFGIPILEAMKCDVPVITSNVSSMPEIAGDAALLVDPYSVEAIANAMQQLTADSVLRTSLIKAGRVQAAKFNWDHCAAALWESCEKVLTQMPGVSA